MTKICVPPSLEDSQIGGQAYTKLTSDKREKVSEIINQPVARQFLLKRHSLKITTLYPGMHLCPV